MFLRRKVINMAVFNVTCQPSRQKPTVHDHECYDCVLCCIAKLERILKMNSELQELKMLLFSTVLNGENVKNEVPEYAQGQARAYIGKRKTKTTVGINEF